MNPNLYFTSLDDLLNCDAAKMRARLDARHPAFSKVISGKQPVILYPAARMARHAAGELRRMGANVLGFGDGNASLWGAKVDGLPVLTLDQIVERHKDAAVFVCSVIYDSAISDKLTARGCGSVVPVTYLIHKLPDVFLSRDYKQAFDHAVNVKHHAAIRQAYNALGDEVSRTVFRAKLEYYLTFDKQLLNAIESPNPIYFDRDIVPLLPAESFVDGGAFTGDTLADYLRECAGKFSAYYAFEPDPANFEKLKTAAASDPRIHPLKFGLSEKSGTLRFLSTSTVDAKFLRDDEAGGESLNVLSLDDFFATRPPPTLIKMDIEGSEASALNGAARTIKQHAPRLAISIYHYPTDLWELPLLMKNLNPDYRLSIRHYGKELADTVCYAVKS